MVPYDKWPSSVTRSLSDERIRTIADNSTFSAMERNPLANNSIGDKLGLIDSSISKFMRKGEVGDWKNYFSQEQSDYIDALCEKKLSKLGLVFDYEL